MNINGNFQVSRIAGSGASSALRAGIVILLLLIAGFIVYRLFLDDQEETKYIENG